MPAHTNCGFPLIKKKAQFVTVRSMVQLFAITDFTMAIPPAADSAHRFPHTTMLGQGHEGSWVEMGRLSPLHPGKKTSPSPALLSFGCFEINSLAGEGRGEGCTKPCAIKKPALQECRGSKTSYHLSKILHHTPLIRVQQGVFKNWLSIVLNGFVRVFRVFRGDGSSSLRS